MKMHTSTIVKLLTASFFLFAFALPSHAVVINNLNYKKFTGTSSICPDGSRVLTYQKVRYCRAYRANIRWSIPTTRMNGTPLRVSELKGYEVYWTRTSDNASGVIRVPASTQTTTAFDVYTPSTYYFAMSAIDTSGLKSKLSPMVAARLGR